MPILLYIFPQKFCLILNTRRQETNDGKLYLEREGFFVSEHFTKHLTPNAIFLVTPLFQKKEQICTGH